MSNCGLVALLCASSVFAGGIEPPVSRANLRLLERSSDQSFESLLREDPMTVLGYTRAVYLPGYGVVFSAEVEVAPRLTPNPFRPAFTKEEIAKIRDVKRARIALLEDHMREMLRSIASNLKTLPLDENVALAVTIPYSRSEDAGGMPRQIIMSAPRRALLAAAAGDDASLRATLKVQELL